MKIENKTFKEFQSFITIKNPVTFVTGLIKIWQRHTFPELNQVSSALVGLTSLFGMGRGEHHCYSHHNILDMV